MSSSLDEKNWNTVYVFKLSFHRLNMRFVNDANHSIVSLPTTTSGSLPIPTSHPPLPRRFPKRESLASPLFQKTTRPRR